MIIYLANNNIRDLGCKYLSQAIWNNLIFLNMCTPIFYLADNNFEKSGYQYLNDAKRKWTKCDLIKVSLAQNY
jgi:hypothetical protein